MEKYSPTFTVKEEPDPHILCDSKQSLESDKTPIPSSQECQLSYSTDPCNTYIKKEPVDNEAVLSTINLGLSPSTGFPAAQTPSTPLSIEETQTKTSLVLKHDTPNHDMVTNLDGTVMDLSHQGEGLLYNLLSTVQKSENTVVSSQLSTERQRELTHLSPYNTSTQSSSPLAISDSLFSKQKSKKRKSSPLVIDGSTSLSTATSQKDDNRPTPSFTAVTDTQQTNVEPKQEETVAVMQKENNGSITSLTTTRDIHQTYIQTKQEESESAPTMQADNTGSLSSFITANVQDVNMGSMAFLKVLSNMQQTQIEPSESATTMQGGNIGSVTLLKAMADMQQTQIVPKQEESTIPMVNVVSTALLTDKPTYPLSLQIGSGSSTSAIPMSQNVYQQFPVMMSKLQVPGVNTVNIIGGMSNTKSGVTSFNSNITAGQRTSSQTIAPQKVNPSTTGLPQKPKKLPVTNKAIKKDLTGGGLSCICIECDQPLSSPYHAVLKNCDLCPFSTICSAMLCGHFKYKHNLKLKLPTELKCGYGFLMECSLSQMMICGCQKMGTTWCNAIVDHVSECKKGRKTCRLVSHKSPGKSKKTESVVAFGVNETGNSDQIHETKMEGSGGNVENQSILNVMDTISTTETISIDPTMSIPDTISIEPIPLGLYNNLVNQNYQNVPDTLSVWPQQSGQQLDTFSDWQQQHDTLSDCQQLSKDQHDILSDLTQQSGQLNETLSDWQQQSEKQNSLTSNLQEESRESQNKNHQDFVCEVNTQTFARQLSTNQQVHSEQLQRHISQNQNTSLSQQKSDILQGVCSEQSWDGSGQESVTTNQQASVRTNQQASVTTSKQASVTTNQQASVTTSKQASVTSNQQPSMVTNLQMSMAKNLQMSMTTNLQPSMTTNLQGSMAKNQQVSMKTHLQTSMAKTVLPSMATNLQKSMAKTLQPSMTTNLQGFMAKNQQGFVPENQQNESEKLQEFMTEKPEPSTSGIKKKITLKGNCKHSNPVILVECGFCGAKFKKYDLLSLHMKYYCPNKIGKPELVYCVSCGMQLASQAERKTHQVQVHNGKHLLFETYEAPYIFKEYCILKAQKSSENIDIKFQFLYDRALKELAAKGLTSEKIKIEWNESANLENSIRNTVFSDTKNENTSSLEKTPKDNFSGKFRKIQSFISEQKTIMKQSFGDKFNVKMKIENLLDEGGTSLFCNICDKEITGMSGDKKENCLQIHFYEHFHSEERDLSHSDSSLKEKVNAFLGKLVKNCNFCKRTSDNYVFMATHLKRFHINVKCSKCGKLQVKKNFPTHLKYHEENANIQCDECGRLCKNKISFQRHKRMCKDVKCKICGVVLRKISYKFHLQNHENKKVFQCKECGKGFNTLQNRRMHVKRVHKHSKLVNCHVCGKEIKQVYLKSHLKNRCKGSSEKDKVQCPVCAKRYKSNQSLEIHKTECKKDRIVKNKRIPVQYNQPFICSICGKFIQSVRSRKQVERHMESHNKKSADFHCDICNKDFKGRLNLYEHMSVTHGEAKYTCQYCGKKFTLKAVCEKHEKAKHLRQKEVQCTLCNYKCYDLYLLKSHMKFRHKISKTK